MHFLLHQDDLSDINIVFDSSVYNFELVILFVWYINMFHYTYHRWYYETEDCDDDNRIENIMTSRHCIDNIKL